MKKTHLMNYGEILVPLGEICVFEPQCDFEGFFLVIITEFIAAAHYYTLL